MLLMSFKYCFACYRGGWEGGRGWRQRGWQHGSTDVGHLSRTETRRGRPRVDFEGREKFRCFGEIGWSQGLVFQAKGPNSMFKGMEA